LFGLEDPSDACRAVVKDRLKVAPDAKAVQGVAQAPQRKLIPDLVADQCSAVPFLECVSMVPEAIGAA
jgi:hypothetical protein